MSFELTTPTLARWRSTAELRPLRGSESRGRRVSHPLREASLAGMAAAGSPTIRERVPGENDRVVRRFPHLAAPSRGEIVGGSGRIRTCAVPPRCAATSALQDGRIAPGRHVTELRPQERRTPIAGRKLLSVRSWSGAELADGAGLEPARPVKARLLSREVV